MTQRSDCFASVEDAVAAIGRGDAVVVVDDEDRENEGDLIMAAEFATRERIAFFVRHTSGVICVPLTGERCDELGLPLMVEHNTESHRTAFTDTAWFAVPSHTVNTGSASGSYTPTTTWPTFPLPSWIGMTE